MLLQVTSLGWSLSDLLHEELRRKRNKTKVPVALDEEKSEYLWINWHVKMSLKIYIMKIGSLVWNLRRMNEGERLH